MYYSIKKNIQLPAYMQLYEHIKKAIVTEVYPYGSKLPSKRVLADEASVSVVTVEHAYTLLWEEGYIEPRQRSGYFVIFRSIDGFAKTSENRIQLHACIFDKKSDAAFPFSVLAKNMRKVISEYGELILEKSPNQGCLELRSAIAGYLGRNRGICVKTDQIIIGSGAEYLYHMIVGLLGRERRFAIESPSYDKIEQVYRSEGVALELLAFGSDGIDSKALATTNADVLHVSPYRSFPTGITVSASKRFEYINWAVANRGYIVEDDFESEFSISKKAQEPLFAQSGEDNVIYLNTFSKTISPALRVGYMVLPEHLVDRFDDKLGFYSCTVPTFEQFVLAELLNKGDFERHVNRVRRAARNELLKK